MAITSKGHEKDLLLVALVPILWGLNFPATAIALRHFPPLLAAALRFAILCIPAALFFPRPKVELKWLVGTGFGLGERSQRYSMLVKDGVVTQLNIEQGGEFKVSSAEHLLAQL